MSREGDLGERREVWWCPEGNHVDDNHHTEGNYLDICSRCGGVCELRSTAVVKERRRRRRRTHEEVVAADEDERAASEVKVYEGAPFAPAGAVAARDAATFARPSVEPPFELTDLQRVQLLEGETFPTIALDRMTMPPIAVGDVVEVTATVRLVVLGFKETVTHQILLYEIHDDRTERIRTKSRRRIDDGEIGTLLTIDPLGKSEGAVEHEPEPISRKESSHMARLSREDEIASLASSEAKIEKNLKKLEEDSTPTVCMPLRDALNAIAGRRERLEKSLRRAAA